MTSLVEPSEEEKTSSALRDVIFGSIIAISFVTIAVRLWNVQILQGADHIFEALRVCTFEAKGEYTAGDPIVCRL